MLLAMFAAAGAEPVTLESATVICARAGRVRWRSPMMAFDLMSAGKKADHSRTWKYSDLQQLELAPDHIRVRTYEDIGWQAGKDREYLFDRIGDGSAAKLYPLLAAKLDQRFVAECAGAGRTDIVGSAREAAASDRRL